MFSLAFLAAAVTIPVPCNAIAAPFVGAICTPKNDTGKHPAMILLGGSEGGDTMAKLAPQFAAHGYVTASVAYFGEPGLPAVLVSIPVETVGRALDALQQRSDVDPSRIGILGVSKGGEFAMLAASTYPQFKAVVSVVGSPVAFMGLGQNGVPEGCSWSAHGAALPCISPDPTAGQDVGIAASQGKPLDLRPLYDASLDANPKAAAESFFPIEKIQGPVLCLAGADDQLWDSPKYCEMAMARLHASHHPYRDVSQTYPDAGHLFITATHGPASAITQLSLGPVTMLFGGTKDGNLKAAARAWPEIWSFLAANLGGRSP